MVPIFSSWAYFIPFNYLADSPKSIILRSLSKGIPFGAS